MSETEQNKQINKLKRQVLRLEEKVGTLELDLEPKGRVADAFDANEQELTEIQNRIIRLEQEVKHGFNQVNSKLEIILNRLTGVDDLPEE